MLVSVIVPVYNVEDYLGKCLDSIINQTHRDLQIIVVNDGTPDDSQTIIDDYAKKDSRILPLIKENGGLADARNYAIPYIEGEYCLFIDSDDWIEATMVSEMLESALENKSQMVFCDIRYVYQDGSASHVETGYRELTDDSIRNALLSPPSTWNKLYKTSLFETGIRYPKGLWYEDLGTSPKLYLGCEKISYVKKPFINYLQRSGSIMATSDLRNTHMFNVLDEIYHYYQAVGVLEKYFDEICFLFIEHLALYSNYRFLRLPRGYYYMDQTLKVMNGYFRDWKKNPYLRILRDKDQKFLIHLNPLTTHAAFWAYQLKRRIKR